jgi:hypothetical protein
MKVKNPETGEERADEPPSYKGQCAGSDARNAVNEQLRYVVIHSAPLSAAV